MDGETVVKVAEIEAARDVAIAKENTAQTEVLADAQTEIAQTQDDEDVAWLRAELADLRGLCGTNGEELSALRATVLTMQEQMQQMADQLLLLTAAATLPPKEPPTPEPDLNNPPPDDGEGADQGGQKGQDPPQPPPDEKKKRGRRYLQ